MAYTAKNLKELIQGKIPKSERFTDLTYSPLLDILFHKWLKDLKNNPKISSFNQKTGDINISQNKSYEIIIDGELIKIFAYGVDICVGKSDKPLYMANRISCLGWDCNQTDKVLDSFKDFIQKQNLEILIKETADELKKKDVPFFEEIKNFYSI